MSDNKCFWMTAKFNSTCVECEGEIQAGKRIVYEPGIKKAYCDTCGPEVAGDDPQ